MAPAGEQRHKTGEAERRADRRYPINAEIEYRILRRRRVLTAGRGWSVNLSTGGLLFEATRALPPGFSIEIDMAWPAGVSQAGPLILRITGRTVRAEGEMRTAVRILRHTLER